MADHKPIPSERAFSEASQAEPSRASDCDMHSRRVPIITRALASNMGENDENAGWIVTHCSLLLVTRDIESGATVAVIYGLRPVVMGYEVLREIMHESSYFQLYNLYIGALDRIDYKD